MENNILLSLAITIILSKILGAISRKFKQPPVIGMLFLGIILGPTLFNLINPNEIISWIAEIGVLFLLFEAGLETNLKKIKEDSRQAILPALGGILLPFILGFSLGFWMLNSIINALIIGVIFTATSVSVSVMSLIDMDKLRSLEGRCIVNSAIIDDVIGILLLTFIFGIFGSTDGSSTLVFSLLKIGIFFVGSIIFGLFIVRPFFMSLRKFLLENAVISLAIATILIYAWFAEMTGLAAITGAYIAGLFIGQTRYKHKIQTGITNIGKSFFVDIFFVNIGLHFNLAETSANPLFLVAFVLFAIVGKIVGSGLGARLTNFDTTRSFRIGVGMVPRGEVALIIANMAFTKELIQKDVLSATILMVVGTAVITPILLNIGFQKMGQSNFKTFENTHKN
ncbi:MAG: cation:proton antiporter [Candidatus Cloacimonetes bacterium]|jgi:Kef-type K+ transport system membrane component KefB|nr:cation:proton antiporter [Candidatus Cloacimonadota bacterium]MBT6994453.1 cation:proton antiporter [Candidatus Cloacimonadota bacterium]MBT7470236.1 cation:proton antiporter [Candidatus Cloacimonadota bacterium]